MMNEETKNELDVDSIKNSMYRLFEDVRSNIGYMKVKLEHLKKKLIR